MELDNVITDGMNTIRHDAGLAFLNVECATKYISQLDSLTKNDIFLNSMIRKIYAEVKATTTLIENMDRIAETVLDVTK